MYVIRKNQIFGNYKNKYCLFYSLCRDKYDDFGMYAELSNVNNIIYIIKDDCVYAIFKKIKDINFAYKLKGMLMIILQASSRKKIFIKINKIMNKNSV